MSITTTKLWSGIQGAPYSAPNTVTGGGSPYSWTISSGALPAGLTIDPSTGTISGTPSVDGTFTFTVQVTDFSAQQATKSLTLMISSSSSAYGNTPGDAYATEGGAPNPAATVLMACSPTGLNSNAFYRLGQNLTAATPGTNCLTLGAGTKLDLAGFTVTGRIVMNANASNVTVFNGTVNCTWPDNGGDAGCVKILSQSSVSGQMRLHHLTIVNSGQTSRGIHIDWHIAAKPAITSIRVFNNTITVTTQPTALRSFAIGLLGTNQTPEFFSNDLTCNADAAGCQGIMCFATADCKMHHNRANMIQNTTAQGGRAFLFDGNTLNGEAWNNQVTANNNRAFRIRDSFNVRIHDNKIFNITDNGGGGAIHLADPDTGKINDLNALVDNNDIELSGAGTVLMMRTGFNAVVRDNRFTCLGSCEGSRFIFLRSPLGGQTRSELTVQNNPNIILYSAPPPNFVESGATLTVCNSGAAGGSGTTIPSTCP